MVDAVDTMAYAKASGVPWHGLGNPVESNLTPEEMCKAAKLDWTVSKRQVFFKSKTGKHITANGEFAIVRDNDETKLTMVGSTWKEIQNIDSFRFFKKYTDAGKMTMETAGSLWNGRYVWVLARVGKGFTTAKKDEFRPYLLLMSPHVFGKSLVVQYTGVWVVCWNTLNLALGSSLKGDKTSFRVPHSVKFDDAAIANAEAALGLAEQRTEELQQAVELLSKTKVKPPEVEEFFCEVLKWDPKKAEKNKDGTPKEKRMLPKLRLALEQSPGHELVSRAGTLWGAVNAVTYVVDHETGHDRSAALHTAWLGQKAALKRRALDLAIKRAS